MVKVTGKRMKKVHMPLSVFRGSETRCDSDQRSVGEGPGRTKNTLFFLWFSCLVPRSSTPNLHFMCVQRIQACINMTENSTAKKRHEVSRERSVCVCVCVCACPLCLSTPCPLFHLCLPVALRCFPRQDAPSRLPSCSPWPWAWSSSPSRPCVSSVWYPAHWQGHCHMHCTLLTCLRPTQIRIHSCENADIQNYTLTHTQHTHTCLHTSRGKNCVPPTC